jgi:hypothetical protein
MNFGGPVWHASGRGKDVLTSRWLALRALESCGSALLGQWIEDRRPGGVVHVRRRLTPAEASHVNELRNIRGSAEEKERLHAIACVLPSQLHPFLWERLYA